MFPPATISLILPLGLGPPVTGTNWNCNGTEEGFRVPHSFILYPNLIAEFHWDRPDMPSGQEALIAREDRDITRHGKIFLKKIHPPCQISCENNSNLKS